MPNRFNIIETVGKEYLKSNIENDEFSYQKEMRSVGIDFDSVKIARLNEKGFYKDLDLRFVDADNKFAVLVETKQDYSKDIEKAKHQLNAYLMYEKKLNPLFDIVGIIANTNDNRILVYHNSVDVFLESEKVLKPLNEYLSLLKPKHANNREEVMRNTYELNEKLHEYGINEKIRGQFVGTCLLAIKQGLVYANLKTTQIKAGIRDILTELLNKDLNKAEKLVILDKKVLNSQDVSDLKPNQFIDVLSFIETKIFPYINDKSTLGQDLLNLFFTIFNKYVGKADKNQAFTPDHIVDFMCKAIGINKNSRVLDPCCGSGAFLVRALTDALDDCDTQEEAEIVKREHIYGIEYEEKAFGLSTTNMLIHGDGNTNVVNDSCFNRYEWIKNARIDRVLMNPPYNAQKKHCKEEYVSTWDAKQKEDPSKGFHFVYEIAEQMTSGKLAVLLPTQCAIGTGKAVKKYKELMLQKHHLDAVFSLPIDIFHPGANASACCMIFEIGIKHDKAPIKETFFGYYRNDGFTKRKNLGRVEKMEGIWEKIKAEWLDLYFNRKEKLGLSVVKSVKSNDEWLAEAYMETDYSSLDQEDFQQTLNNYLAYLVKGGCTSET